MKKVNDKKDLSSELRENLLVILKARFEKNMNRHKDIEWSKVQAKLKKNADKMWSLNEMEQTDGETVFVYHNGAESYYSSRGFRGSLRV